MRSSTPFHDGPHDPPPTAEVEMSGKPRGGHRPRTRIPPPSVPWPGKPSRQACLLDGSASQDAHPDGLERKLEELTREIRERRAVEDELQRQKRSAEEADRRKSESLAAMSHEMRAPLHGIMGYLQLLESGVDGSLPPKQEAQIQRIKRATEHLSSIIETSLTFSALEAGPVEPTWEEADALHIASEARDIVSPAAVEKGIASTLHPPKERIRLRTDPGKVRQILVNLLSNGIKFTDAGQVSLTLRRTHDSVVFAVRDTGVGIREEDLERIFEPYRQVDRDRARRTEGTGLGLTVTRGLARLLGGDIGVRSVPGRGSTFTLHLPLSDSPSHPG